MNKKEALMNDKLRKLNNEQRLSFAFRSYIYTINPDLYQQGMLFARTKTKFKKPSPFVKNVISRKSKN